VGGRELGWAKERKPSGRREMKKGRLRKDDPSGGGARKEETRQSSRKNRRFKQRGMT